MRELMLAAALLVVATSAYAADLATLPVKALPPVRATCPVGTGFYGGVNSYGQVANGSINVNGTTVGTMADGAAVGLTLGYAWGDCVTGRFYAFEGLFDYQNLSNNNGSLALSLDSKWEFTQRFKIGANLSDVMTFLPNFGTIFPGFPQVAQGTSNPKAYVAGVVREADVSAAFLTATGSLWSVEPGIGVGIQSQTANGSVVDVFTDYTFKGGGFVVGANAPVLCPASCSANLGGVWRAGVQVLW